MQIEDIQEISRSITHLVFRNGEVENLHTNLETLSNETMKKLNKDVNNRVFTLLYALINGTQSERERLFSIIADASNYGRNEWDEAVFNDDLWHCIRDKEFADIAL